jgi:hypothetical protein
MIEILFTIDYIENKEMITIYKQTMKDIKQKIEESKVYISKEDRWCEKPHEWSPTGNFTILTTRQRPKDLGHFIKKS